ncbi:MAG: Gfo/Idh/MocA family oxidoreductase [Bacteroidetes bacterium]|nr:Gfo/Idh/MocA family oxidoreductase [Bacteroidota bacterium]MBL7002228.1 Gfo/Idh/MocA family oxidoreductase [Nitrosopumilus sp.]
MNTENIYNIAVIGAGQLGSRHLQGLAKSSKEFQIYVIDPNENALILAKQRFEEVSKSTNSIVSYRQSMSDLPGTIDLAIIATTANVRRKIIENLLDKCSIKYLILEKVVFQKSEDFKPIQKRLLEKGVKAWVNCARRSYSFYKNLTYFYFKIQNI